jgi:hypothetical protein
MFELVSAHAILLVMIGGVIALGFGLFALAVR